MESRFLSGATYSCSSGSLLMTRLLVAVLSAPRFLASLVAFAAFAPLSIFAAAPETEWSVDDSSDTLLITEQPASGTAWVFSLTSSGVFGKTTKGSSTALNFRTIPLPEGYGIETIGASFMSGDTSIKSVYFPSTVTNISNSAFNGCTSLVTCDFPEGTPIERVGNQAFMNDAALVAQIGRLCPPTVTWLGGWAFYKCGNVTGKVFLPALAGFSTSQGNTGQQFYKCGLRDAEITSPFLTAVGGFFPNCTSITNITISCENLTSISKDFAINDSALKNVSIDCPKLTTIGQDAFKSTGVKTLTLSAPLLNGNVNSTAFSSTSLKEVTIFHGPFVQNETDNTATVMDRILTGVTAVDSATDAAKNCVVYVPVANKRAWECYADALAGYESAHAPKYAFGVYSASSRKAYMAALGGSPGFAIIVR